MLDWERVNLLTKGCVSVYSHAEELWSCLPLHARIFSLFLFQLTPTYHKKKKTPMSKPEPSASTQHGAKFFKLRINIFDAPKLVPYVSEPSIQILLRAFLDDLRDVA